MIGKTYLVQVWVNDSRATNLGQTNDLLYTTLSDGIASVNLHHNTNGAAGGIGQYVIVMFKATATAKNFTITGGTYTAIDTARATSLMMAYQVRVQ
jgi:hypothetical protein